MNQMYKLLRKVYTVLFSLILFFIVVSTRACQHLRLGNVYSDPKKEEDIRHWVESVIFCTVDVPCRATLMPPSYASDEALKERVVSFFIKTTRSPDMATLWNQNMEAITEAKKRLTEIGNLEKKITSNPNRACNLQSELVLLMIESQLIIDDYLPLSENQRPQRDMVQRFFYDAGNRAVLNKCRRIAKGLC